MNPTVIIALVAAFVGLLQSIVIFMLNSLKSDVKEIQFRIYDHYHEVECQNTGCHSLRTGNVIVPGARAL